MNLRPSNCYRSYDKSIPEWLHNRPKNYVKHCLEKMELTKEINTRNLFKSEELQKFTVTSSTNPEKFYEVYLGDYLRIPNRQSIEWKRKLMACEHVLAITNKIKGGWNSMSLKYRDSNYEVIGITNNKVKDSNVTTENQKVDLPDINYCKDSNEDGNGISEFSQIPTKSYPKRTKGAASRELSQQIKSLMYLVSDKEHLENLHKQLNIIFHELNRSTTTDFGLVINKPEKNENKRSSHSDRS